MDPGDLPDTATGEIRGWPRWDLAKLESTWRSDDTIADDAIFARRQPVRHFVRLLGEC